jgi:hypothetical protein
MMTEHTLADPLRTTRLNGVKGEETVWTVAQLTENFIRRCVVHCCASAIGVVVTGMMSPRHQQSVSLSCARQLRRALRQPDRACAGARARARGAQPKKVVAGSDSTPAVRRHRSRGGREPRVQLPPARCGATIRVVVVVVVVFVVVLIVVIIIVVTDIICYGWAAVRAESYARSPARPRACQAGAGHVRGVAVTAQRHAHCRCMLATLCARP